MINRFRMVAGPNGSGKSTLAAWLARDYAVNFYTMLNADDVYALVQRTHAYFAPFPIDGASLAAYAGSTSYADAEKGRFSSGEISVDADCVRFATAESVNSYTIALLVNFLQDECINRGISFSQETVFSHPSKVAAQATPLEVGTLTVDGSVVVRLDSAADFGSGMVALAKVGTLDGTLTTANKVAICAGGQTICAGKLMLSDGILYAGKTSTVIVIR